MKIVFMGSADFGLPALEMLFERYEVAAIVSTPPRPKGRGLKPVDSPVTEFAKARGIGPVLTPEDLHRPELIRELAEFGADIFVVVAFRILPKEVFIMPRLGTVNIHASLLPHYRGAAPIHRAIEAGERETGVTVFRIDEGVDTGEIIVRKKTAIGDDETTPELYERLSVMGAEALREVLDKLDNGDVCTTVQNVAEATRAPKLSKPEGHVNWKLPASTIYNKIRAFKPFPGTYSFVNGKRINIEWGTPVDTGMVDTVNAVNTVNTAGTVLSAKGNYIDVQCGNGILRISKIKPEGRPIMDVHAYLLGHNLTEGTIFE